MCSICLEEEKEEEEEAEEEAGLKWLRGDFANNRPVPLSVTCLVYWRKWLGREGGREGERGKVYAYKQG